jgi:hypothetical protein
MMEETIQYYINLYYQDYDERFNNGIHKIIFKTLREALIFRDEVIRLSGHHDEGIIDLDGYNIKNTILRKYFYGTSEYHIPEQIDIYKETIKTELVNVRGEKIKSFLNEQK